MDFNIENIPSFVLHTFCLIYLAQHSPPLYLNIFFSFVLHTYHLMYLALDSSEFSMFGIQT